MEVGIVIQSMISKQMADEEFALLEDQKHFEKVWSIMLPNVENYVDDFLVSVSNFGNLGVVDYAYSTFVKELIDKSKKSLISIMIFLILVYLKMNIQWILMISKSQL